MFISLYLPILDMGKMNVVLSDELEEKFRNAVFQVKGMKKGNISEALEEALEEWISREIVKIEKKKK